MSSNTAVTKCCKIDAGEWKNPKNTDGIPPLGSGNTLNCDCSACKAVMKDTSHWTSMQKEDSEIVIKIGDRVLVHGCLPGVVRYVGDLDSNYTNDQVYIGVKLDEPVGNNDGTYNNKRYFSCPENHGIIVPIEKVHILVPTDGRTITVKQFSANRFFSMPDMSGMEQIDSDVSQVEEQPQRVVSDGYLCSYQATPTGSMMAVDDAMEMELEEKMRPYSLGEERMTRSTVFVCHEPGSISVGVEVSESVKSMIRQIHSDEAGTVTADDTTKSAKDLVEQEVTDSEKSSEVEASEKEEGMDKMKSGGENEAIAVSTSDSSTKAIAGSVNSITTTSQYDSEISIPPTITENPVNEIESQKAHHKMDMYTSNPSMCMSSRKLLASSSVPSTGSQFSKLKLAASKSASSSVSTAKKSGSLISKLATNVITKSSVNSTPSPCTPQPAQDEDDDKKPTTELEEQKVKETMEPKDIETEDLAEAPAPPKVPVLAFMPEPESSPSASEPSTQRTLVTKPSYTSNLLSSLPDEGDMTPLSANTQLNEVMQFGDWVSSWGGGMKGWVMAHTLQKLKDAERKGAKEVEWQKTLDELEKDEEFGPRIRHIKVLREEIHNVQKMNAEVEQELKGKKIAMSASQLCKEIENVQNEITEVRKKNKELADKIRGHPLIKMITEILKQSSQTTTQA